MHRIMTTIAVAEQVGKAPARSAGSPAPRSASERVQNGATPKWPSASTRSPERQGCKTGPNGHRR
jgi:hypothetical protein